MTACGAAVPWCPSAAVAVLLLLYCTACSAPRQPVTIFHAGSLSRLIANASERFQRNHPGVLIQTEASGSLDAVRKITELNKSCDLIAVADYRLIERFLGSRVSRSYIFLGNELVLATALEEPSSDQTTGQSEDWYEKLSSGRYSYGTSDPNRDPAGYYAHLAWKLAEMHYDRPGLYARLLGRLDESWVRPKSSELVALLQTGTLDFAFLYKSTALQNNLDFVAFPAEVSLAEDSRAGLYARVFTHVAGETPETKFEVTGMPIRYGIALTNPPNLWADRLLDFLLSPEVQDLYRELGYASVPISELPQESTP